MRRQAVTRVPVPDLCSLWAEGDTTPMNLSAGRGLRWAGLAHETGAVRIELTRTAVAQRLHRAPTARVTAAGTGAANFSLTFAGDTTRGPVTLNETQQADYTLVQVVGTVSASVAPDRPIEKAGRGGRGDRPPSQTRRPAIEPSQARSGSPVVFAVTPGSLAVSDQGTRRMNDTARRGRDPRRRDVLGAPQDERRASVLV